MKCGLELHMQVNTGKLFCRCPNIIIRDEAPDYIIKRKLHAVAGETGLVDVAAVREEEKNQIIKYNCYNVNVCLVDTDEEPPREIDEKAFKTALEVALLLNMKPVDEFHVMRKLIIDGSAVSGFQRTGLLATNGYIETSKGRVGIATLCLEEDSAKRVDDNTFSLDRLGIPLIEIATMPDITDAMHAKEVAEKIGTICKFTGKLMRGIGTIRQDVNVSIPEGERVEIKGVQDLKMMPRFVELEAERQSNLLILKEEVKKRRLNMGKPFDVSAVFKKTNCGFLKGVDVHAMKLSNGKGLLGFKVQGLKSFGKELAEVLNQALRIKGLLHVDELPAYGVSVEELRSVVKVLDCGLNDGFIIIACNKSTALKAHTLLKERLAEALKGVPREVRAPNHADGTTSFLRPLPGGARMYPETDVNVIRLSNDMISSIINNLSKTPEEKFAWLKSTGLNDELANQLLKSDKLSLYERVIDATNADNKITASLILSNPVEELKEEDLIVLFQALEDESISKEAFPEIVEKLRNKSSLKNLLESYKQLSTKQVMSEVKRVVKKNQKILKNPHVFGIIMKELMTALKGKADAGVVSELVRKELGMDDNY